MSRTIFALCTLALVSGCQTLTLPGRVPAAPFRMQTVGSCGSLNGGCSDCIPHRPLTICYIPWMDNVVTRQTAEHCAERALRDYRRQCGRVPSHHFKRGFVRAYKDLAMNRRPSPPVIPPQKYWHAYYRSCAGQPDVEDWFDGYETGLEWGYSGGVSQFREIYLNRGGCGIGTTNQSGNGQTMQGSVNQRTPNPTSNPQVQVPNSYGY